MNSTQIQKYEYHTLVVLMVRSTDETATKQISINQQISSGVLSVL